MSQGGFFDFLERQNRSRARPAPAESSAGPGAMSVSDLTALVEAALRTLPDSLLVKGEISNFSRHRASGHLYFTLKDAKSCIDCVMFASSANRVRFEPTDGLEVIAGGQVRIYPARGRYQLYVSSLQPVGQGALELAFRQLCDRLRAEGLFAPERKKPIPKFPRRVALVTARGGAALQDMLKVFKLHPHVRLSIVNVAVQGATAAPQIARAIRSINRSSKRLGGFDLMIIGRGGGSLEDLWAFNEEVVARAIAESEIPVISGVGHEVDTTVADLVADHRAHTPTEAATYAVRHWREVPDLLDQSTLRLRRTLRQVIERKRRELQSIERAEVFRRPMDRVRRLQQLLDDQQRQLQMRLLRHIARRQARLRELSERLRRRAPTGRLRERRERLDRLWNRLTNAVRRKASHRSRVLQALMLRVERVNPRPRIALERQRLEGLARELVLISPIEVLKRGYSITRDKKTGKVIRSVADIHGGERLLTRVADGTIESIADDPRQPRLFE